MIDLSPDSMDGDAQEIEALVLTVHRRNGGKVTILDWNWRLLDAALGLDSLDLAEVVAGIERRFGISLFDQPSPPHTWEDVKRLVMASRSRA
ncbi:MAG: acyl carrier protein [Verrucomicrobiota bacterium]